MSKLEIKFACVLALLLAGGLQACCFRVDGTGAKDGAAAAGSANPVGVLEIASWGPQQTKAGVAFNAQQDGHARLWIRVNRPLGDRIAMVQFNDAIFEGQVSGDLVTAIVPAELYAEHGTYAVRVFARQGNAYRSSNTVKFTVE